MGRIIQRASAPIDITTFDPGKLLFNYDDFEFGQTTNTFYKDWRCYTNGTGSTIGSGTPSVPEQRRHGGWVYIQTGTTTTGRAAITKFDASTLRPGIGETYFECVVLNSVSTDLEAFNLQVGLHDAHAANGEPTDGVYFRYTHTVNSGKWVCHSRAAGVETTLNAAAAYVASATSKLAFKINHDHTAAQFWIQGVLVGSITTNIPNEVSEATTLAYKIEKTAGTTSATLAVDYNFFWKRMDR